MTPRIERFPPEIADQIKVYVYRLLDPRTGETFYVGKGQGDRVFNHVRGAAAADDDGESQKLKRIREIQLAGFEVAHVIHRHGLDDATALEVEAALIDAYPGLCNEASGLDSGDRGTMHAGEIVVKYRAEEAVFTKAEKVLLINVNRQATERPLYEAVRYAWKINLKRASEADVILATRRGIILGAFVADEWLAANAENFPGRLIEGEEPENRYGFVGKPAANEVSQRYVGKRVPDRFRKQGAANPIRYAW